MGICFAFTNLNNLKPIKEEKKSQEFYYVNPDAETHVIHELMLEDELKYIVDRRQKVLGKTNKNVKDAQKNLVGLCFSGGGIRSAIFNLGVIQALFRKKVLDQVDYLSTVSGGGYIGACLTSLLNSGPKESYDSLRKYEIIGKDGVIDKNIFPFELSSQGSDKAAVSWLRYFSNYLTAEGGFVGKYFMPAMIFLRGLITNFFVTIPYILLISLLLYVIYDYFSDALMIRSIIYSSKSNLSLIFKLLILLIPIAVLWTYVYSIVLRFFVKTKFNKFKLRKFVNKIFSTTLVIIFVYVIINTHYYLISLLNEKALQINNTYLIGGTFSSLIILSLLFSKKKTAFSKGKPFYKVFLNFLLLLIPPTVIIYLVTVIVDGLLFPENAVLLNDLFSIGSSLYDLSPAGTVLRLMVIIWFLTDPLINVNDYSLHSFYRDRLSRAYLIQNNSSTDPFSTVEHKDVVKLSQLYTDIIERKNEILNVNGPYNIINTTLNLKKKMPKEKISSNDEEKSELQTSIFGTVKNFILDLTNKMRKGKKSSDDEEKSELQTGIFRTGENFIFSKYWCGSAKTGYIDTKFYEGCDKHIDLATATAISGAAVNVAMAEKSISSFRLLFSLLNIRLGYWAKNPWFLIAISKSSGIKKYLWWYPKSFIKWSMARWVIAKEWINDYGLHHMHINLSDGGHFDNLGAYELLKRKCKYIIISDAEADPQMSFQALAYLIRVARIDLGVQIDINTNDVKIDNEFRKSGCHCAVGTIEYPDNETGYLLYIKSSITGDEPEHLKEYRVKEPTFPHQTTADQWFDEQQFEAYRELGYHITKEVFSPIGDFTSGSLEDEFIKLKQYWHPHSKKVQQFFVRHTTESNKIYNEIKNDPDLEYLDRQFWPQWEKISKDSSFEPWIPEDPIKLRKGFYICNMMIQLMENVYIDLDLETEYMHPDNRGWINEFRRWSQSNMFRLTWAISAGIYGTRFVTFGKKMFFLRVLDEIKPQKYNDEKPTQGIEFKENIDYEDLLENDLINKDLPMDIRLKKLVENNDINPIEYRRIHEIILNQGGQFDSLIKLKFVIRNILDIDANKSNNVEFDFALALLYKKELVFLRVQNQLRGMGLGRQALKFLVRKFEVKKLNENGIRAISKIKHLESSINSYQQYLPKFERMLNSVVIEMSSI